MTYQHKVQYYETDMMKITHHSNYVRWMEEMRVYFLEQIGAPMDMLESMGIVSPVIEVSCEYKGMTHFGDVVSITACLAEFNGVKMQVYYAMHDQNGALCCLAKSRHCFMKDGKIINMKKKYPEIYEKFLPHIGEDLEESQK